jgi:adenylate kinase family enzyme
VPQPSHIHLVGASGSGTTTLGKALAEHIGGLHLDTDDFYWAPTDPPFTDPRPIPDRIEVLNKALAGVPRWVLSGSLMKWGESFVPSFDLVVFLYVPPEIRIPRLLEREAKRYGARIEPGGEMHAQSLAFIEWARGYDREDFPGRSLHGHRAWLKTLPCPVLKLDGAQPLARSVEAVMGFDGI